MKKSVWVSRVGSIWRKLAPVSANCFPLSPPDPCVQITTADHRPGKTHFPSLLHMTMTRGCPQPLALGSVTSALLLEGHYCLSADFTTLLPHPLAFCLLHPRSVLSRYAVALRKTHSHLQETGLHREGTLSPIPGLANMGPTASAGGDVSAR